MRGAGGVSAATRERVLAAVEELGYRPNAAARNLVQRRTNLIGVVVWDIANAFDAELVKRIEQHASALGYATIVCNTGGARSSRPRASRRCSSSGWTASRWSTSPAIARSCRGCSPTASRS